MNAFCTCEDWNLFYKGNHKIFIWDPAYGWVLNWVELTEDTGYTQVHRYGVPIRFCPMCGKELKKLTKG